MKRIIYTIGHSTHSQDYFLELLQSHGVNAVVDVRSVAASTYNPQYNQNPLQNFLKRNDIMYLHFAEAFGARQTSAECLDLQGRVDFEKVRQSTHFLKGIERLVQGAEKGYVMALMCAESDPCNCHRFGMICPALEHNGFETSHIHKDNSLKTSTEQEDELLLKYAHKIPSETLFGHHTRAERLQQAHQLLNQEIGYQSKL